MKLPTASVVVLSRSQPARVERLIARLDRQLVRPERVVVIWSGESTLPWGSAVPANVELISIPPREFGHGRTRNLALGHVSSELAVYLSDDAWPADERWLGELVRPFIGAPEVGAAFSRQVADERAGATERAFRGARYPNYSFAVSIHRGAYLDMRLAPLSNASAAYRVEALRTIRGFEDDLPSCEDLSAAVRLLKHGYEIHYVAESCVVHSHGYGFLEQIRRTFDSSTGAAEVSRRTGVAIAPGSLWSLGVAMLRSALNEGSIATAYSVAKDMVARAIGLGLGQSYRLLPRVFRKQVSRQKWFYA